MKKIIAALESGADRAKTIAALSGNTLGAVRTRLSDLRRLGVVRAFRLPGGSRPNRSQREKRYALILKPYRSSTT